MGKSNGSNGLNATLEQVQTLNLEGRYEEGLKIALDCLQANGWRVKRNPSSLQVLREVDKTRKLYGYRRIKKSHSDKGKTTLSDQRVMALITEILPTAIVEDGSLLPVLICLLAQKVSKYSVSEYTALGYTGFGYVTLRYMEDTRKAIKLQEKAEQFMSAFSETRETLISRYFIGTCLDALSHPYESSRQWLSVDEFKGREAPLMGLLMATEEEANSLYNGLPLSLETLVLPEKDHCALIDNINDRRVLKSHATARLMAAGEGPELKSSLTTDESKRTRTTRLLLEALVAIHYDRYSEGGQKIDLCLKEVEGVKVYSIAAQIYYYYGIVLARKWFEDSGWSHRRRMKKVVRIFSDWYNVNPERFDHLHGMLLGLNQIMNKQGSIGLQLMEEAIAKSEAKGNNKDKALGLSMLSLAHTYLNHSKSSLYYAMASAEAYRQWGAEGVAEEIEHKLGMTDDIEILDEKWNLGTDVSHDTLYQSIALFEKVLVTTTTMSMFAAFSYWLVKESDSVRHCHFTKNGDDWYDEEGVLLEQTKDLAVKAVRYCINHEEVVVVNRDRSHTIANYDGYLMDHQDLAVLALPFGDMNADGSVLYMEKQSDYSEEQVKLFNCLCDQVAYYLKSQ